MENLSPTKLAALASLAIAAIGAFAWVQRGRAEGALVKIMEIEKERTSLKASLKAKESQIAELDQKILEQGRTVASLRDKILSDPKPFPPQPLPPEPTEQVRYFEGFKLTPALVEGAVGSLAFPPQDLPILAQGLQDSRNLPIVQTQLVDTRKLVLGLDDLIALKDGRIRSGDEALKIAKDESGLAQKEIDQFRVQLTAEKKRGRASQILWGVAGIGIGTLLKFHR